MVGLLLPAALAAVLALIWPARERARPHGSKVHWWPAAVGAFLCELALYNPPLNGQPWAMQLGPWLWLLTRVVLIAVALRNMKAAPAPWLLVAIGLTLNGVVIAANDGHMPQSREAAAQVWGTSRRQVVDKLDNTRPIGEHTRLNTLGDIIAQPAWLPRANVVSIGDLVLSLGIALYVFQAARGRIVGWIGIPVHAYVPTARAGRGNPALRPR
jgi:hypothetical protein